MSGDSWFDAGAFSDFRFGDEDRYNRRRVDPDPDGDSTPAQDADEEINAQIINCRWCQSDKIKLKESNPAESDKYKFQCLACKKYSTYDLPTGYARVYVRYD